MHFRGTNEGFDHQCIMRNYAQKGSVGLKTTG